MIKHQPHNHPTAMKTIAALILALASVCAQASVVLTNPFNNTAVGPLGESDTTTYGQVFTTPDAVNTVLDSFSLIVRSSTAAISNLYAGVATWVNGGAGTAVFTSAPFSGNFADWTEVIVGTGGVDLTPGQEYVAFFSASGLFDGTPDGLDVGLSDDSETLGFVFDNSAGASPLHANWDGRDAFRSFQLAGSMEFSPPLQEVPEPASLALLGAGLLAAAAARRRRSTADARATEPA